MQRKDDRIRRLEARIRALEDIEQIRQLKGAYCVVNDGGWAEQGPSHKGPMAELFVEDAVLDARPLGPVAEGREAIHRMLAGYRSVPFTIHYVMNPMILVEGDIASGDWHALVRTIQPDGTPVWILGLYHERYVRTGEGWRYKSVRFIAARIEP